MEADPQCGYICGYIACKLWVHFLEVASMRLTDIQIKRIKPDAKPYKVSDGGGLFLWVTPSGGKIWRWTYRHEGRAKLMTFGKYPDVPLSLARERHTEARKLLAAGTDPMAERKAEKAAAENSFQCVARLWLAHWQDGKSPRHVDYVKRRMDADIFPCFGARPIALIEAPELVAMTKSIEQRGARDIAKRALETTRTSFRFARSMRRRARRRNGRRLGAGCACR
jgi:hypothetical protein